MIPIFIASSPKFEICEKAIVNSILDNTESDVDIHIVHPGDIPILYTGCTGFTNVRFAIPHLLEKYNYDYGIYFDVDMIILGDVADLFAYREEGKYVCLQDGSTEVGVISRTLEVPSKNEIGYTNKFNLIKRILLSKKIPLVWNVEDEYRDDAMLIHFTDLKRQPWFYENHPCEEIWRYYDNNPKPIPLDSE